MILNMKFLVRRRRLYSWETMHWKGIKDSKFYYDIPSWHFISAFRSSSIACQVFSCRPFVLSYGYMELECDLMACKIDLFIIIFVNYLRKAFFQLLAFFQLVFKIYEATKDTCAIIFSCMYIERISNWKKDFKFNLVKYLSLFYQTSLSLLCPVVGWLVMMTVVSCVAHYQMSFKT